MSTIEGQIKKRLKDKGLSAYTLEKKAGLKPSAVQNILYGRSKSPSIHILQAIARTLECTVDDLVEKSDTTKISPKGGFSANNREKFKQNWNHSLYMKCFERVLQVLQAKDLSVSRDQIIYYADEFYSYALRANNKIDIHFLEWLVDQYS